VERATVKSFIVLRSDRFIDSSENDGIEVKDIFYFNKKKAA
jgi:hypothetical protein